MIRDETIDRVQSLAGNAVFGRIQGTFVPVTDIVADSFFDGRKGKVGGEAGVLIVGVLRLSL